MTDRSDAESWQDEEGGCHACLIGRTVVGVGWTKVDTTSSHSGSVRWHASVIQHHRTHGFFGAVRDGPGHALHCILRSRLVISQIHFEVSGNRAITGSRSSLDQAQCGGMANRGNEA